MVAPTTRLADDQTLPAPWKALIDGSTGYVYYWNTVTNETTYDKPSGDVAPQGGYSENGHAKGTNGCQPATAANVNSYKRAAEPYDSNNGRSISKRPKTDPCTVYEAEAYRKEHEITVLGDNVPLPFMSFDSALLPPEIMKEIQVAGFASPTPIQAQSWPIAMHGRDIVAVAKTGSGKTLGYLLPAFLHLQSRRNNGQNGPTVLVLAPTRELATQIHSEAGKFGRCLNLTSVCVYGGANRQQQMRDLSRGPHIVIATPGRLNDFLEQKTICLRQVSYLVLDEADRMLDMGFEPQIRKIVAQAPSKRQTLMYTATWPKEVRKIAADLLTSPAQVNIGNTDNLAANKSITQIVEVVLPYDKMRKLEQILRSQEPGSKIIIFCSTKKMCDELARNLRRDYGAAAIHGDKSQTDRDWVLQQFKTGKSPVLVATDVAARGLDIKDIRVVVNYDFPTGVEDYVHRIGRTGRAGATGLAHTFFSEQDGKYAKDLIKVLEGANQKVPAELRDISSRGGFGKARGRWDSGGGRGNGGGRGGFGDYGGRNSWNSGGGRYDNGRGSGSSGWGNDDRKWGNDDRRGGSGWGNDDRKASMTSSGYGNDDRKGSMTNSGWGNGVNRDDRIATSYNSKSPTGSRSRSYDRYNEEARGKPRSHSPRHRTADAPSSYGYDW